LRRESNDDLLSHLRELISVSNSTTAEVLAHLAEIDSRSLFAAQGYSSLFTYAVSLGLSESAAYKRIQCARLARRFPVVFDVVASGDVHLSGLTVLSPHLTEDNHAELLAAARHMTKRQVEELVAARFPRPDAPNLLRRLPAGRDLSGRDPHETAADLSFSAPTSSHGATIPTTASPAGNDAAPTSSQAPAVPAHVRQAAAVAMSTPTAASVTPLSSERFKLQVTLSRRGRDLLLKAQALMRHRLPDGDMAEICEQALELLVGELERRKFAKTRRPTGDGKAMKPAAGTGGERMNQHAPGRVHRDPERARAGGNRSRTIMAVRSWRHAAAMRGTTARSAKQRS
jgi:hypothetical protein